MSMIDCPYYQTGTDPCRSGCWEEPRCITDKPAEGWLAAEASMLREAAWEARGRHGLVKHYRDAMRQAEKREARELARLAAPSTPALVTVIVGDPDEPACRVSGCTDSQACPGGCWWVPGDIDERGPLCSCCRSRP